MIKDARSYPKFSVRRVFKKSRQLFAAAVLATTLLAFWNSPQFGLLSLAFHYWDPVSITEFRLKQLSTGEFKAAIEQLVEAGEISEAGEMVELATRYGHAIPEDLIEKTKESSVEFGARNGYDFLKGAATGEFTTHASLTGVLAADYLGVGDVRDITIQGQHILAGEDYDKLTTGLALFGLATVVPGSGPLDAGASLVKTANKAGKLSKSLRNKLTQIAGDLIDMKALKESLSSFSMPKMDMPSPLAIKNAFGTINWPQVAKGDMSSARKFLDEAIPVDTKAAKAAFSRAIRPAVVDEVKIIANSTGTIAANGGPKATFAALEHADDAQDLSRFGKLSQFLGKSTAPALRLLGKSAILLGNLMYQIITIVVASAVWFLCALWTIWSSVRVVRELIS